MVTCWERADLLALVGEFFLFLLFFCIFVTFPCGILVQVWYLIVSFPDLCRLSYVYVIEYRGMNELLASATVDLRPSRSAFFHKNNFLRVGPYDMTDVMYQTIQ